MYRCLCSGRLGRFVRFAAGGVGGAKDHTGNRLPPLEFELTDIEGQQVMYRRGRGVPGPGRVDQRLYIRVCEPPPYVLRLVTEDLDGYHLCPNSPELRLITERSFRPLAFQRTEVRFGLVR